ncbi:MAG: glycoside hydrolase family 2 protein [Christensenellales bacterium]
MGSIILIAIIVAAALELMLLILWILTETIFAIKFDAPKTIDDDFFKECSCNGVPYIIERGIPYRGSIESRTNVKVPLNDNYRFKTGDSFCSPTGLLGDAESVDLPHCYNKMGSPLENYKGDVWYERVFEFKKVKGKPVVRLVFMGSFLTTDVWLDGVHLGKNYEGYLPFYFDISALEEGSHKLVIRVNNETSLKTIPITLFKGHRVGWHHFSGIHKEVYLEYLSEVSLFKLNAMPMELNGKWSVNVSFLLERTFVKEDMTLTAGFSAISERDKIAAERKVKVCFVKGEKVAGTSFIMEIDKPELWSEETPSLYTLNFISDYEQSFIKFGLRKVSSRDGKIMINHKPVFLRGICRHEDNGEKGLATDAAVITKELKLVAKANGNFVRLAHYPHSKVTLDITDKMGMYAWAEVPFYQAGHRITHDFFGKEFGYVKFNLSKIKSIFVNFRATSLVRDKHLLKLAAQSLIKLVERDINHPSVITWGVGNEVWSINEASGRALKWLKDTVKRYDTSRAINYASMSMPLLTVPCEKSFKYMDWACVNEYFGWYYGKIKGAHSLAEGICRKYPDKPIVITETGSDTLYGLRDESFPPKNKHSEDYQKYFLEETFRYLNMVKNFSGMSVWVFKDFPCPEYTETNPVPFYNMKGLFDKDMREKLGYKTLATLYKTKK